MTARKLRDKGIKKQIGLRESEPPARTFEKGQIADPTTQAIDPKQKIAQRPQNREAFAFLTRALGIEKDGIVKEITFRIKSESQQGKIDAFWVALKCRLPFKVYRHSAGPFDTVDIEGKLYTPPDLSSKKQMDRELVIFQPGLPGGGALLFEERHVQDLVKRGYAVLVLRNKGLDTSSEKGNAYTGCKDRTDIGNKINLSAIGNPDRTQHVFYDDSVRGVEGALRLLAPGFGKIHLIGHSYGGLAVAISLGALGLSARKDRKGREALRKVESVVFAAPLLARPISKEDEIWWGEELAANQRSTTSTTLGELHEWMFVNGIYVYQDGLGVERSAESSVQQLVELSVKLHGGRFPFPDTVKRVLFINPSDDEYIKASGVNKFIRYIPRNVDVRGIVYSEGLAKEKPPENRGIEAHDMWNTKPEELAEFFKGKRPKLFREES